MCARDKKALQNRYKKMIKAIRKFSAWETENARGTGGGPGPSQPNTDGIIVHGGILALKMSHGVGITGLAAFDSDTNALEDPIDFQGRCTTSSAYIFLFFIRFL